MDLSHLLAPSSIAVIGASDDPAKLSSRPLRILQKSGFAGPVFAVNPSHPTVLGVPTVASPLDLPEPPDVAIVVVPAPRVPRVVEEVAQRGTRDVIVLSAGFNETSDGAPLADRLQRIAATWGLRLVGPNSEGLWSAESHALMTHGASALDLTIRSGRTAVISQSGSIGAALARSLSESGAGFRYFISTGNELGLTLVDFLEHLVEEASCSTVVLFIEGLRDGERLPRLLDRARDKGISVIGVKAGTSPIGASAVVTHTGKLASPGRLYDDIFTSSGAVLVQRLEEAVGLAHLTSAGYEWRPGTATGIGIVSASGGSRALLVDEAWRRGAPVATFSAATVAAITAAMSGRGTATNPVDVDVAALYDRKRFLVILDAIAADPAVDSIVVQFASRGPAQLGELVDDLVILRRRRGKPLVLSLLMAQPDPSVRASLGEAGIVITPEPTVAVTLVSEARILRAKVSSQVMPQPPERVDGALSSSWELNEEILRSLGVPLVPSRVVKSVQEMKRAWRELDRPLAIKATPGSANHKSDLGLVHLRLVTLRDTLAAYRDLRYRVGGAPILVQSMVTAGEEILLSAHRDAELGPILTIGAGGLFVESEHDVVHLPAACTSAAILRALPRLRLYPRLEGRRGRRPADLGAFSTVACAFGSGFAEMDHLLEVEVNPLFVLGEGQGVLGADIRVRLAHEGSQ